MSKALCAAEGTGLRVGKSTKPFGKVIKGNSVRISETDEELIRRITPIIEKSIEKKVTAHVIETLIDTLEQQNYPSEENLRPEFIEEVKRAQKSKGKKFKTVEEFEKYLSEL